MIVKDSHGSWTFVILFLLQWRNENLRYHREFIYTINVGRREEERYLFVCYSLDDFNTQMCLEIFSGYH